MHRTVLPLDLSGIATADLLALARLLDGPPATQQAPTLARLLAEALAGEVALRLDAVDSGILAGVRAVVLPPDLAPGELTDLEALLWRWTQALPGDGLGLLLDCLHDGLLRLRARHAIRAGHLMRAVEGGAAR